MTLFVHHVPDKRTWPKTGGVREHCRQLFKQLFSREDVALSMLYDSDVVHVQSSYRPPPTGRIDVYTCHGGFVPSIPQVIQNLRNAKIIISVAQWIVDKYFEDYWKPKTVVIPNGVDLSEWADLPPSGFAPGYVLWGKGFLRKDIEHFLDLAEAFPGQQFLTTLLPTGRHIPRNVSQIGLQPSKAMRSIINDCAVYVSTGSEVCPTMVLEAWACAKPVLAWHGHGNEELMFRQTDAVFHPYRRRVTGGVLYSFAVEAQAGLRQCLSGASETMGLEGRHLVETIYNWPRLVERTIEVYRDVAMAH